MKPRYKELISGNTATIPYGDSIIVDEAFKDCTYLEKVIIPNSVTEIGYRAFEGCTSLIDVEIPNSVKCIKGSTFKGCTSLQQLLIPSSVQSLDMLTVHDDGSIISPPGGMNNPFTGCDNLTHFVISQDNPYFSSVGNCVLSKDGTVLFFGTRNSIIPESVEIIEDYSFYGEKIESLDIPNSVKFIGNGAFLSCSKLKSIEIPNSVKQIGITAFNDCDSLSHIEIPESLIKFDHPYMEDGSSFFRGCNNITDVTVSKKNPVFKSDGNCILSKDGMKLLFGCKHSVIPPKVMTIDSFAFYGSTIDSIDIPESVRMIEWGAFDDCFNLKTIKIHNPNPEELEMENAFYGSANNTEYDDFVDISTISLVVPIGCGYAYRHHPFFKRFKEVIPRL